jgi:pyruvate-formate lyase-activating enzyme
MSWYCPLPYNSLSSEPLGKYALCCESKPSPHHCNDMTISQFKNSEYMKKVREGFKRENPLEVPEIASACFQCKLKEDQGVVSKRQRENKEDVEYKRFMELKLIGNICNYACLMCAPNSSSKIAEEQGVSFPKYFNHSDEWWDDFKEVSKEYNYFKFSGGEPFMSPTTKKIIDILINSGRSHNIKLQFNTNGSASKSVLQRLLNNFNAVNICFSIDAWGERNSLIRKHSSWDFTENRIWDYLTLLVSNKNMTMSIHPCVSILNIGYLHEFENIINQFKFTDRFKFSVSNTLAYPLYYNAAYLPQNIKQVYLKNNYEFLNSDLCDASKSVISLLQADGEDLFKFKKGISHTPHYKKWYPEFIAYA